MADLLTEISALHAITATETVGTAALTLPGPYEGTVDYPSYKVRVQYWDAQQASGSGVWTFTVQISYTNGATWTTAATGTAITLTAALQSGEQLLTVVPNLPTNSGQILLQVIATLTGSPVTPTIAYRADLVQ